MKEFLINSVFFGALLSLAGYELGLILKKKFKLAIFNPLLIASVSVIAVLFLMDIDYESYNEGGKYLSYLLTPATVSLAVPLYEQLELLKKNLKAVAAGIISGVIASVFGVFALCKLFGMNHQQYVTLLPKSITTAIGMGVSEELGGIVTITVAVIVITGVLGNVIADLVYKIFPKFSISITLFIIDALIILSGFFVFGLINTVYAIIIIFISSKLINGILGGLRFAKAVFILSHHSNEISEKIFEKLNRGNTEIACRGMYTKKEGRMLFVVVWPKELVKLKRIIGQVDPNAFITICSAQEVLGKGFLTDEL